MFKKTSAFLFFLLMHNFLLAQQNEIIKKDTLFPVYISLASYTTPLHPGFRLGGEYLLEVNEHHRIKKNNSERIRFGQKIIAPYIAVYNHKNFNTNIILASDYIMRRIRNKGRFNELLFGGGLSRTFVNANTYTKQADGTFAKANSAGSFYGMFSVCYGFGRNFEYSKNKKPIMWFVRTGAFLLFPYQSLTLPQFLIQAGINWKLTGINIQRKSKYKIINHIKK